MSVSLVDEAEHLLKLVEAQAAVRGQAARLGQQLLELPEVLLPYQFKIFAGDEAAPAGLSDDKALALQLFVGPLCRDDAYAQLLRQEADGRKGVPSASSPEMILPLTCETICS